MTKILEYRVEKEDISRTAGGILGKILKNCMGLTPHEISHLKFTPGGIAIRKDLNEGGKDGGFAAAAVKDRADAGDIVRIQFFETSSESEKVVPAAGMDVRILYEDEDVVALDKPAGIVTHPSHGHYRDSITNYLAGYYEEKGMEGNFRAVGRLDKDTSGIIVFAKNTPAASRLFRQKEEGIFRKTYLAVAENPPGEFELNRWNIIDLPIGPIPGIQMKQQIAEPPAGKRALTRYFCSRLSGDRSLITAEIETGRTHQIRLHMASAGHPLVGDRMYGEMSSDSEAAGRTLLHAWKAVFRQPFEGKEIQITAAIPDDMRKYS